MEENHASAMPKEYMEAVRDYATMLSGLMCKYGDKWGETPKSLILLVDVLNSSRLIRPNHFTTKYDDSAAKFLSHVGLLGIDEWETMSRQEARNIHIELHNIMEDTFKMDLLPKPEEKAVYPNEVLTWNEEPCDELIFGDPKMIKATFALVSYLDENREVLKGAGADTFYLYGDDMLRCVAGRCLEHINYDAFKEMGGKLSFSVALLNDNETGFIINSIHSSEGCYVYTKEIVNGECAISLGDEEKKALTLALSAEPYVYD